MSSQAQMRPNVAHRIRVFSSNRFSSSPTPKPCITCNNMFQVSVGTKANLLETLCLLCCSHTRRARQFCGGNADVNEICTQTHAHTHHDDESHIRHQVTVLLWTQLEILNHHNRKHGLENPQRQGCKQDTTRIQERQLKNCARRILVGGFNCNDIKDGAFCLQHFTTKFNQKRRCYLLAQVRTHRAVF